MVNCLGVPCAHFSLSLCLCFPACLKVQKRRYCLSSKTPLREFPGGPVVRTQRFHCQGLGSIPGWGTNILYPASRCQKRKEKKKTLQNKKMPLTTSPIEGSRAGLSPLAHPQSSLPPGSVAAFSHEAGPTSVSEPTRRQCDVC